MAASASLHGHSLIARRPIAGQKTFRARSPLDGTALEPAFHMSDAADVDAAMRAADAAFVEYRQTTGEARATFLERIADEIVALGDALIERAHLETGLPAARLTG